MNRVCIETKNESQTKENKNSEENKAISEELIKGEKSDFSDKSIEDIWNEARKQYTEL